MAAAQTDSEALVAAGKLLFGDEWQRPLAKNLGGIHPDGPRGAGYDRVVRRWAAGERSVPPWVWRVLPYLLQERALELYQQSKDALDLSMSVRARAK